MNKSTLRCDVRLVLQLRRISLRQLAREAGIDISSLWRFMQKDSANLTTDSLFKLWPHIYGSQSPELIGGRRPSEDS